MWEFLGKSFGVSVFTEAFFLLVAHAMSVEGGEKESA